MRQPSNVKHQQRPSLGTESCGILQMLHVRGEARTWPRRDQDTAAPSGARAGSGTPSSSKCRLDTANLLLIEVRERADRLNQEGLAGPAIRLNLFELVGLVEQAVIALGRAVDMVYKVEKQIGRAVAIPRVVAEAADAVKDIRDSYEHIDERAAGNVWRKPHPDALTIFDWRRLLTKDVIAYGSHQLELSMQIPALIAAMRQFFKDAAADG